MAQVEIDEYQNYQKALGALSEALKCLGKTKTKNPAALEAKVNFLKERIKLVNKFANARRFVGYSCMHFRIGCKCDSSSCMHAVCMPRTLRSVCVSVRLYWTSPSSTRQSELETCMDSSLSILLRLGTTKRYSRCTVLFMGCATYGWSTEN